MSEITLELDHPDATLTPGEAVRGRVRWRLHEPPRRVEVRVGWYTEGKGTPDWQTVQQERWEEVRAEDERSFNLPLPAGPHTYHGKLISILWAVEAEADRPDAASSQVVTFAPRAASVGPVG